MGAPGLWEGTKVETLGQMPLSPQLDFATVIPGKLERVISP